MSSVNRCEKTTPTRSRGLQSTARWVMKRAGATPVCGRSSRHKPASLVSSLWGSLPPLREVRSVPVLHAKDHQFLKRLDKEKRTMTSYHTATRQTSQAADCLQALRGSVGDARPLWSLYRRQPRLHHQPGTSVGVQERSSIRSLVVGAGDAETCIEGIGARALIQQ